MYGAIKNTPCPIRQKSVEHEINWTLRNNHRTPTVIPTCFSHLILRLMQKFLVLVQYTFAHRNHRRRLAHTPYTKVILSDHFPHSNHSTRRYVFLRQDISSRNMHDVPQLLRVENAVDLYLMLGPQLTSFVEYVLRPFQP